MNRTLTCIICPRGCTLQAHIENGTGTVTGNACRRGEEYGISECLHPMRTVTAVIGVVNRDGKALSVKTKDPIPKEHIFDLMAVLRGMTASAPVAIGDVICDNIYGTRVIATGSVE